MKYCFELSNESERDGLISDINVILRACGRPYGGYPALGRDTATAFNSIFKSLTGQDHHQWVHVYGQYEGVKELE